VLDIGAGSGHWRPDWFHLLIRGVSDDVVGIELSSDFVAGAQERGVELIHGDAEDVRLDRTFDVVFAGELIEHLSCFSGLLETARAHLGSGGRLVLTTPNAFAISNFVYRVGGQPRVNAEHTCWFCEDTLATLLERHDFEVEDISYLKHTTLGRFRRAAARVIRSVLPDRLAQNTLLAVARAR
jgi:SAM-dependent methyltransferase